MNLLPSPDRFREKSIMFELGFMIDKYLIERACQFSSNPTVNKELIDHLTAVSKVTLSRISVLDNRSCF